jgi:hypothetical protein
MRKANVVRGLVPVEDPGSPSFYLAKMIAQNDGQLSSEHLEEGWIEGEGDAIACGGS